MPLRLPAGLIAFVFLVLLAAYGRAADFVDSAERYVAVPDRIGRVMAADQSAAVLVFGGVVLMVVPLALAENAPGVTATARFTIKNVGTVPVATLSLWSAGCRSSLASSPATFSS